MLYLHLAWPEWLIITNLILDMVNFRNYMTGFSHVKQYKVVPTSYYHSKYYNYNSVFSLNVIYYKRL